MPAISHSNQNLLDLNSIKELPETHAWTPVNDQCLNDTCDLESVPFIDLLDENATQLIRQACKTWGVFQIINHNISMDLLDRIEQAGKKLFSLPLHQKLRAARRPDEVVGYGVARISSFFPKLMWSEGFTIDGSPLDHARLLWPNDYDEFWYVVLILDKESRLIMA